MITGTTQDQELQLTMGEFGLCGFQCLLHTPSVGHQGSTNLGLKVKKNKIASAPGMSRLSLLVISPCIIEYNTFLASRHSVKIYAELRHDYKNSRGYV